MDTRYADPVGTENLAGGGGTCLAAGATAASPAGVPSIDPASIMSAPDAFCDIYNFDGFGAIRINLAGGCERLFKNFVRRHL